MNMVSTLHRAVQYIAAAGIGHAQHEADDGHTSMVWEDPTGSMVGVALTKANDIRFAMSILQYAMQCRASDGSLIDTMPLQGAEHDAIMEWFQRMIRSNSTKGAEYRFAFHYDLPAHSDHSVFPAPDAKELDRMAELRGTAHKALEEVLTLHDDTEPLRIWPHHFDSGGSITLSRLPNGTPLSTIGMGLAIPDHIVSEHYFYVSPWHAEGAADLMDLPELSSGRWSNSEWKGAILEAEGVDLERSVRFFKEASEALLDPVKH